MKRIIRYLFHLLQSLKSASKIFTKYPHRCKFVPIYRIFIRGISKITISITLIRIDNTNNFSHPNFEKSRSHLLPKFPIDRDNQFPPSTHPSPPHVPPPFLERHEMLKHRSIKYKRTMDVEA